MPNNIYQRTFTHYIVYETVCQVTGKRYVGCHATDDLNDGYLGSGKLLIRAIAKHGKENFERTILHYFTNPHDMFSCESSIVTEDFVADDTTYNLVVGGCGGFKVQDIDSWKEKLTKSSRNRKNKQPMSGKKHTEKTKQQISETNKGRLAWNKGLPGTWIGRNHSDESKKKISQSRKGQSAGKKNPMYGKSAVAGRKWFNDGVSTHYLFPDDPATANLSLGRLRKPSA